ncbi:hypothetical protein ABXM47_11760, partial [Enterococcus faecium]|uniref:hypothetical protein n=1 Tax=Enterococcus faecium TaxID=1352 RepID=UPI00338F0562
AFIDGVFTSIIRILLAFNNNLIIRGVFAGQTTPSSGIGGRGENLTPIITFHSGFDCFGLFHIASFIFDFSI